MWPRRASSWQMPEMQEFMGKVGGIEELKSKGNVLDATADQCAFGLQSRDEHGRVGPALKPTRFLTNPVALYRELNVSCRGCPRHAHLDHADPVLHYE